MNHAITSGNYKCFDLLVCDCHASFSFSFFDAARAEVDNLYAETIKSVCDDRMLSATVTAARGWVND
jgi:hypothetical protein